MIRLYKQFFLVIFLFFKSIERGYKMETDARRVLDVVFLVSVLETFNIYTLFSNTLEGRAYAFFFGTLCIINYLVFYRKEYWRKVNSVLNE